MRLALVTAALCLAPLAAKATQETPHKNSLTHVQPAAVAWPDPPAAKPVEPSASALKDVPLPEPRPEQIARPEFDPDAAPHYSHEEVCETLVASARQRGLPVAFFARLIWQESQFKPKAVSPVGAIGIAQFMPQTARGMDLANPFDALQALPASAELLDTLKRRFGNIGLAAAAYNSTPKRIADWLKNRAKLPDETKKYVLNITGRPAESWKAAKSHGPLPQLPRQVPCTKIDEFVEVEMAERRELERTHTERMMAERALTTMAKAERAATTTAKAERTATTAAKAERTATTMAKAERTATTIAKAERTATTTAKAEHGRKGNQKPTVQVAELTARKKKAPEKLADNKAKAGKAGNAASKNDKPLKIVGKVRVASGK